VLPVNLDLVARRRGPARKKDDVEDARICCPRALDACLDLRKLIPHGPVPVADPDHVCSYTEPGPYALLRCKEDVSAWLVRGDEGTGTRVVLHHGDENLPEMKLDAAEDLARAILGLVQQARGI